MKNNLFRVILISFTILMSFNSCNKGVKSGGSDQIFGEKSGIVTYKPMEMMGVKVTQTLYFDDFGKKSMRETVVEGNMQGMEMRQHTIDIMDGSIMYHYEIENISGGVNRATKDAYKAPLTPEMIEQMNVGNFSEQFKAKLGYKDEGKETVAGIEGLKYSMALDSANPGNRITGVHYKNIPLKVSMGEMEMLAEKVELNVKIPAEKFKVPEGYTIKDQPANPMQQMPAEGEAVPEPENK
jgi:hypothetical protein